MSYYRFVEETEQKPQIWPVRVQTLFDEHNKASRAASKMGIRAVRCDYTPETIDYHEKIFDDRATEKPESLKVTINAIYRAKYLKTKEEFYFYAATKMCT
jgi:hypothetical protein